MLSLIDASLSSPRSEGESDRFYSTASLKITAIRSDTREREREKERNRENAIRKCDEVSFVFARETHCLPRTPSEENKRETRSLPYCVLSRERQFALLLCTTRDSRCGDAPVTHCGPLIVVLWPIRKRGVCVAPPL